MKETMYHRNRSVHSLKYDPPAQRYLGVVSRLSVSLKWMEVVTPAKGRKKHISHAFRFDLSPECIEIGSCAGDLLTVLAVHGILPSTSLTFNDFIHQLFIPRTFHLLQKSTQDRYWRTLRVHLFPVLEARPLACITASDLQEIISDKVRRNLGWEVVCHIKALLAKIFACARAWGYTVGENPAEKLALPRRCAVREKRVLSVQQICRLALELREPVRTMAALALGTGMRIGEILALEWDDCNLAQGIISVSRNAYRGRVGSPKTTASARTVFVPSALIANLRLRSLKSLSALVFPSSKGTFLNDTNLLHRFIKPAGSAAGIPWLSWHVFRRTHATLFQAHGGSLRDTQAQMGHSHPLTTFEVYTMPIDENRKRAIEAMSEVVSPLLDEAA